MVVKCCLFICCPSSLDLWLLLVVTVLVCCGIFAVLILLLLVLPACCIHNLAVELMTVFAMGDSCLCDLNLFINEVSCYFLFGGLEASSGVGTFGAWFCFC